MLKIRGTCSQFGCRNKSVNSGRCEDHQHIRNLKTSRPDYHAMYATSVWKVLRNAVLCKQPVCVKCAKDGRVTPATVVDHMTPHRGDTSLFLDVSNLASLCASCHSVKTGYEAMCRKTKKDPRSFYD